MGRAPAQDQRCRAARPRPSAGHPGKEQRNSFLHLRSRPSQSRCRPSLSRFLSASALKPLEALSSGSRLKPTGDSANNAPTFAAHAELNPASTTLPPLLAQAPKTPLPSSQHDRADAAQQVLKQPQEPIKPPNRTQFDDLHASDQANPYELETPSSMTTGSTLQTGQPYGSPNSNPASGSLNGLRTAEIPGLEDAATWSRNPALVNQQRPCCPKPLPPREEVSASNPAHLEASASRPAPIPPAQPRNREPDRFNPPLPLVGRTAEHGSAPARPVPAIRASRGRSMSRPAGPNSPIGRKAAGRPPPCEYSVPSPFIPGARPAPKVSQAVDNLPHALSPLAGSPSSEKQPPGPFPGGFLPESAHSPSHGPGGRRPSSMAFLRLNRRTSGPPGDALARSCAFRLRKPILPRRAQISADGGQLVIAPPSAREPFATIDAGARPDPPNWISSRIASGRGRFSRPVSRLDRRSGRRISRPGPCNADAWILRRSASARRSLGGAQRISRRRPRTRAVAPYRSPGGQGTGLALQPGSGPGNGPELESGHEPESRVRTALPIRPETRNHLCLRLPRRFLSTRRLRMPTPVHRLPLSFQASTSP